MVNVNKYYRFGILNDARGLTTDQLKTLKKEDKKVLSLVVDKKPLSQKQSESLHQLRLTLIEVKKNDPPTHVSSRIDRIKEKLGINLESRIEKENIKIDKLMDKYAKKAVKARKKEESKYMKRLDADIKREKNKKKQ